MAEKKKKLFIVAGFDEDKEEIVLEPTAIMAVDEKSAEMQVTVKWAQKWQKAGHEVSSIRLFTRPF